VKKLSSVSGTGGSHLSSLAMWEAEIGRIIDASQIRQKVCETPSQPITEQKSARPYFNGKKAGHGGVCLSPQPQWED
jgi:hypothetical protein